MVERRSIMDNQPNGENLELACCPPMERDGTCDVLDYHYRQRYATSVVANNQRVQVEVIMHVRVERCPGTLAVGDLAYTTTLLPGEQMRLFTADRRTRFSFDSASSISYRNQQTSEERFFMASMEIFMSDVSVRDESHGSSRSSGKSEGHAETNGAISAFFDG